MSEDEIVKLLSLAKETGLLAGKFLSKNTSALRKVNKDLEHDVKIEADVQSEKVIIDFLRKHSDFSILSEEIGMIDGVKGKNYVWVVDPVDGSLNYSRNFPLCCVSIGLWKGDDPVLGVIYDFNDSKKQFVQIYDQDLINGHNFVICWRFSRLCQNRS